MIQPGDVLLVSVWREPDLQQSILVRPDGGISFPLAGDVVAAGQTISQLTEALAGKISKFIPSPVVTVTSPGEPGEPDLRYRAGHAAGCLPYQPIRGRVASDMDGWWPNTFR